MKPPSQDSQANMETSHPDGKITQSGATSAQKDGGSAAFVTVISPDNVKDQDVGIYGTPSKSSSEVVSTSVELSEDCSQQAAYHGHLGTSLVPALFVFGGMDTCGTIHSDCFVFVPSLWQNNYQFMQGVLWKAEYAEEGWHDVLGLQRVILSLKFGSQKWLRIQNYMNKLNTS